MTNFETWEDFFNVFSLESYELTVLYGNAYNLLLVLEVACQVLNHNLHAIVLHAVHSCNFHKWS
eukprot:4662056-Prorocentrum_lima.AAC.1